MSACNGCPFRDGETVEATMAQNLACLPTAREMIDMFDDRGMAMSCHSIDSRPCRGLAGHRDVRGKPVLAYSKWYQGNMEVT